MAEKEAITPAAPTGPLPTPSYGFRSGLAQLMKRTGFEMALVFKSPAYAVLLLLGYAGSRFVLEVMLERGAS